MCFKKLTKKLSKNMKWYYYSLLKLSVLFATLFLVTAWTDFRILVLSVNWIWYLVLSIICSIPILKIMFFD